VRATRLATADETLGSSYLAVAVPALLLALSLAGLGISSYLSYTHWANATIACGGVGSCESVNHSKYATLAGVPVAFLGALSYVGLAASALVWLWWRPAGLPWPVMAYWGLALIGTLFSAYLTYVELFVLEAICIYCVASAGVLLASLIVSTAWVVRQAQEEET
jgi:uncharacterized membrane protein